MGRTNDSFFVRRGTDPVEVLVVLCILGILALILYAALMRPPGACPLGTIETQGWAVDGSGLVVVCVEP